MPGDINQTDMQEINDNDKVLIEEETAAVDERLAESGLLTADLIASIKNQIKAEMVADLTEDKHREQREKEIIREQEDIEHLRYVAMMKESDDPWVEFVGDVRDTAQGQRLQMEWNDAFITFLKKSGIAGADEEQIVQKYISLLMRDMTDKMEERYGSDYE